VANGTDPFFISTLTSLPFYGNEAFVERVRSIVVESGRVIVKIIVCEPVLVE
jgi:hypothetical protein